VPRSSAENPTAAPLSAALPFARLDLLDLTGPHVRAVAHHAAQPHRSRVTYAGGTTMTFAQIARVIPCFTPGTRIATPKGEKPVEELKIGDRVLTRDNGIQHITWAGQKTMTMHDLQISASMRPVMIRKGALGHDLPERDMVVSPNHRVLVVSEMAKLYFDESEVLIAAKHLTKMDGVEPMPLSEATYIHFMCATHEIVLSDGAWTESFQPGDYSLQGIDADQREELFLLFPELATREGLKRYRAARKTLQKNEAGLVIKDD
jgi:hypothetical protein